MPKTPTLGQRIAVARRASRFTQQQLAREFDVEHSTVSRWECDRSSPRLKDLEQMARLFKCSRSYLVLGEGDAPKPAEVAS